MRPSTSTVVVTKLPGAGFFFLAATLLPHRRGGREHGAPDLRVRATAAEIAAHPAVDVVFSGIGVPLEQRERGHDLAGGAHAALERIVLHEGGLERVELPACGDALDRTDLGALARGGQREAGVRRVAVDPHRAGAALAAPAHVFRAGEVQAA